MEINAALNVGNMRYVIQPPYRSKAQRKIFNGFKYELTSKIFMNLFVKV